MVDYPQELAAEYTWEVAMADEPAPPSTVTVRLPVDQYAALRAEAERRRTGMSTLIRQAIDLLLKQPEK